MHYYKHNIGDYRRDTAHLTLLEHGVYRQLLDLYYLEEKAIPKETDWVIRRLCARTEDEVKAVHAVLNDFFLLQEDGYRQPRCDMELHGYNSRNEANRDNGKLGGRPKKTKSVIFEKQSESGNNLNHKLTNHKPINTKPLVGSEKNATSLPDCPHEKIIQLYHNTLPDLPVVRVWHKTRQANLRTLWKAVCKDKGFVSEEQVLDFFKRYFDYVGKSSFLTGKIERKDGVPFIADLEWLSKTANYTKVIEGRYA